MSPTVLLDARLAVRGLGMATFIDRLTEGFAADGASPPALWRGSGTWNRAGVVSTLFHSGLFDVSPGLDPRTRNYDVVHFACNVGSLAPGRRSVVTVHDLMHRRSRRPRSRVLGALLERSVVHAGQVVAVSGQTRDELVEAFPALAGRVEVIPHGVRRFAVPTGPREHVLAFGGAADPRKRTDLMVAAYREVPAATTSEALPLVVLARAGLAPHQREDLDRSGARIVDSAAGAEVDGLMRHAAALLYTTVEEGFGLPVLEAGECHTPVVIDARARIPDEVVGAHCFRVTDTGVRSWADALGRAVAAGPVDPDYGLPDWPAVAAAYRAVYERVANLGSR